MRQISKDVWLGLFFLVFSVLTLFVWIPLDTDSGCIEKVRRNWVIGDALAPSLAGAIISLSAIGLLVSARFKPNDPKRQAPVKLGFVIQPIVLLAAVLLIMRWTGPLLFEEYRSLRDTMPWKLAGYLAGGTVLVSGLICFVERQILAKRILLGFLITLAIALIYDLPFEDLLLPPNGDV